MSVETDDCPFADRRCDPPSFELRLAVDDPDAPAEVTVYPGETDAESLVTTWLSAGVDDAVPLDAMR